MNAVRFNENFKPRLAATLTKSILHLAKKTNKKTGVINYFTGWRVTEYEPFFIDQSLRPDKQPGKVHFHRTLFEQERGVVLVLDSLPVIYYRHLHLTKNTPAAATCQPIASSVSATPDDRCTEGPR